MASRVSAAFVSGGDELKIPLEREERYSCAWQKSFAEVLPMSFGSVPAERLAVFLSQEWCVVAVLRGTWPRDSGLKALCVDVLSFVHLTLVMD